MIRALLVAALALAPAAARADRVTLFAAASLKTALDRIEPGFEAATGHDLAISLAGSSALARQIEQGAPADVFISANTDWMDRLEKAGLLAPGTRRDLLSNTLVLIGTGAIPAAKVDTGDALLSLVPGRLAMALVEAVPAGIYGRAALESLGVWDTLAPRVVQADNVRAALALVAAGAAERGIVYATDARAEPRVSVIARFPEATHLPITYPAAVMAGRAQAAQDLLDYLSGDAASAIFAEEGFVLPARR